jgi:hypothetical protein
MTQYRYVVRFPFIVLNGKIYKRGSKRRLAEKGDTAHVSSGFRKGVLYFDYADGKRKIKQSDLTSRLLRNKVIEVQGITRGWNIPVKRDPYGILYTSAVVRG